jgi:hypothetical protein
VGGGGEKLIEMQLYICDSKRAKANDEHSPADLQRPSSRLTSEPKEAIIGLLLSQQSVRNQRSQETVEFGHRWKQI